MAEPQGTVFGPKATQQIAQTVREVSRRMMNEQPHRARWQKRGSGGGGETIWFTIDSVECDPYGVEETYLLVTATWYTGGCSKTPPGAEDDGKYRVYDLCSFFSEHVADDLPGTAGWATYFWPLTGACEARWIVGQLCAQPECA